MLHIMSEEKNLQRKVRLIESEDEYPEPGHQHPRTSALSSGRSALQLDMVVATAATDRSATPTGGASEKELKSRDPACRNLCWTTALLSRIRDFSSSGGKDSAALRDRGSSFQNIGDESENLWTFGCGASKLPDVKKHSIPPRLYERPGPLGIRTFECGVQQSSIQHHKESQTVEDLISCWSHWRPVCSRRRRRQRENPPDRYRSSLDPEEQRRYREEEDGVTGARRSSGTEGSTPGTDREQHGQKAQPRPL